MTLLMLLAGSGTQVAQPDIVSRNLAAVKFRDKRAPVVYRDKRAAVTFRDKRAEVED